MKCYRLLATLQLIFTLHTSLLTNANMMFRTAALALLASVGSTAHDIPVQSSLGRKLLEEARQLEDNDNYSFLNEYSIKFQGCHHVQQWNENAGDGDDGEDDVRIMTKRLARFRLCPADQCSNEKSAGCNSKYGDYIVDMDTFVASYLEAMEEEKEQLCETVQEDCNDYCGGDEDDDCQYACYDGYEATSCLNQDENDEEQIDPQEYAECKQIDMPDNFNYNYNDDNGGDRRLEDEEVEYYIGAYCADQGGEIRLGLFTDDTCTNYVSNGPGLFYSAFGYTLPYSQDSLVSTRCLDCLENANNNGEEEDDGNNNAEIKEVCTDVYALSGKCETKMSIDYPNESSCNYIEGVKIIRQDGVIRTSQTRKSKAAAVAIGLFTTLSVLLAGYVFYLRTKLQRAQINLSAASQPLN